MSDPLSRPDLDDMLKRWVAEGWLTAGQAGRIRAGEAARAAGGDGGAAAVHAPASAGVPAGAPDPAAVPRRGPLIAEALGYVGGVLAVVAGFIAVSDLWPGITSGAQLAIAAAGTIALGAAGALVRVGDSPALRRLRSVLWLLSTVCLAAFMGVLAGQIWDFSPVDTTLVATAVATPYAVLLWWRTRAPLQHLAMFAGAAAVVGTGIASVAPGLDAWLPGLGVWALSAAWGAAAHRGYLAPRNAGYLAAGIGLLTGAQMTMNVAAGHVLALATVAGLFAAGVAVRRVWLLLLGALGVVVFVPQTAARYLPQSVAAPLAVFTVGLVLLGVALWLARARRTPRPR